MKEMNGKIQYKDKEYALVFNLNVMQMIQQRYHSIEEWGALTDGSNGEVDIQALIFGFTEMLNEGIEIENEENGTKEPKLTDKQVGRIITEVGLAKAAKKLRKTVTDSAGSEEKNG